MHGRPNLGYCYVHSAIDAYTRLAYSEALDDETAATALAFWTRARAFFTGHGITIDRVLTDNGSAYKSHAWREEHAALGIKHSRTRVRRPQTNGKVERLNRTLLEEWAYKRLYTSETRPPSSPVRLAPPLQPPPTPHRPGQPPAHHPVHQRHRAVHLAGGPCDVR